MFIREGAEISWVEYELVWLINTLHFSKKLINSNQKYSSACPLTKFFEYGTSIACVSNSELSHHIKSSFFFESGQTILCLDFLQYLPATVLVYLLIASSNFLHLIVAHRTKTYYNILSTPFRNCSNHIVKHSFRLLFLLSFSHGFVNLTFCSLL